MRPLSKPPPASYSPPTNLQFKKASATKIQAVLGTSNPTLAACLDVWLRVVKARKRKPAPSWFAAWEEAAALIEGRVEGIYKEAAEDLIAGLGEYCSYCESRVTGLLEVEHVLAKAEFPTLSTEWDNFLLACGPCNNCKKDTPTRSMVHRWLGTKITNESQCVTEVRQRYYWPDRFADSYRALLVELFYDSGNGSWQLIPLPDATGTTTRMLSVDIPTRTVRADIPNQGLTNVAVSARVTPKVTRATLSGGGVANTIPTGAQEIIDLCGLNTTRSARVAYDRRGLNRTKAWFDALESLKAVLACPTQADFDRNWPQVGRTAVASGFFSVWVRVFSLSQDPSGRPLDQRFVADFAASFAGTNTSQLP